ncbi:hypothetical protein IEQ34_015008 [Dendrobium chrysotoxum]|uniref:Uncharacterized protein n=1 Tax=Dendrobium chrysotoxum TaxID=161865 RepID=A0AAV7GLQ9_DENCH|nr:hypothetical protein IEQ34_015008 [Dendrobium chrysotoxum]
MKLFYDLDYERAFAHRLYYVSNYFMKGITEHSSLISFLDLHPHFFSPRILHGLGSLFGRPIHDLGSSLIARILVEMNITKRYPEAVWLGLEKNISHYKVLGHKKDKCLILNPHLRKIVILKPDPKIDNGLILVGILIRCF